MSKMEVDRERRVTLFNATNDPTFPHSSASQQAFVRELVAAMFKMPVGGITAALVDDWLLDEAIAERAAWEILVCAPSLSSKRHVHACWMLTWQP